MAVVYADTRSQVLMDLDWPEWVADRPAAGACIEQGAPFCTVLASGETSAETRRLVAARASLVNSKFLATGSVVGFSSASELGLVEAVHA
jgi:predicted ATP-grasp superfamily ATP-dependent carboligase